MKKHRITRKQKGYALIMTLVFSTLLLASSTIVLQETNNKISEDNFEELVNETARKTADFSLGVVRAMTGVGAAPGETITVSDLKERNLLNEGYSENIAFNQEIKAHYTTNPDNSDIVDVLVIIDGKADPLALKQQGLSKNNIRQFIQDVIEQGEDIGYIAASEAQEFYIGTVSEDGSTLTSLDGDIDIRHIGIENTQEPRFGIYAEAPNQVGWWRLRVGPYLWQPTQHFAIRYHPEERLEYRTNGLRAGWGIQNLGFSYNCPDVAEKIFFGQEFHRVNETIVEDYASGESVLNVCIQSYKGTVNPKLSSTTYGQIINPIDSSFPEPFKSRTDLHGGCTTRDIFYDKPTLEYKYYCPFNSIERYNLVNASHIQGINNYAKEDAWTDAQDNADQRRLFLDKYKGSYYRYPLANQVYGSGMTFRIDDRYVKAYHISGTIVTGGHSEEYFSGSTHYFNKFGALGIHVVNDRPSESATVSQKYKNSSGQTRSIDVTLPTPFKQ